MVLTLLLSLVFILAILLMLWAAVALVQDKRLFSSAPKDIVSAIQPRAERFKGAKILGWTLVILSMLILAAVFVVAIWDGLRRGYGFWQFFGRFLTILYVYKAFDLVFLDWILLQKTRFFQHYYPETEGCKGYHSYGFNRKSQITKVILFPFISALLAWLCTFLPNFVTAKPYWQMNFSGIRVGAAVFLSIGICHPAVIKMEYYLGKKGWWVWLAMGFICCVVSLL